MFRIVAKYTWLLILFWVTSTNVYGHTVNERNRMAVSIGLDTNNAYYTGFSYHYMVCSLFGVGGGLGIYDQWFTDYSPSGTIEGKWESWRIDETDEEVERLYLHPSILFKTPNILCLKDVKMSFQLEPGLICVFPYAGVHIDYVNSHTQQHRYSYASTIKGDWCFWNIRAAINFQIQKIAIAVGYGFSNWDIYSSRKHLKVGSTEFKDLYPDESILHSVFFNLSYEF